MWHDQTHTPHGITAVPLALHGLLTVDNATHLHHNFLLKNKCMPSPCLQIWRWVILSEVFRKRGGKFWRRSWPAWCRIRTMRWLVIGHLSSARPQRCLHCPQHFEAIFDCWQPFISLFINILHIKICVGSQKRAASTQYWMQWRGLGISGSVLRDLNWGAVGVVKCPFFTLHFKGTSTFFLCVVTKIQSMSNTDLWSQLVVSKN